MILVDTLFDTCAIKIKPYLVQSIKWLEVCFNNYSAIVSSLYKGANDAIDWTYFHIWRQIVNPNFHSRLEVKLFTL